MSGFHGTLLEKIMTENKILTGVVHGRFQPPHNGHIRYILKALEKTEHLIIGICTPKICTDEEAARTGYPCTPALNPFTYQERVDMITLALSEAGVEKSRYECIPFPSDYENIESLIPKASVFLMSVTGAADTKKIAYLQERGYTVETIVSLPEGEERERSGIVREGGNNSTIWEDIVPQSVAEYIRKNDLPSRLGGVDTVLK